MRVLMLLLALQIPLGLDRGFLAPPDNPVTPEKAALGRRLFDDPRLSVDQSRACSDCHQPERAFSDGKRVAVGVRDQEGTRNAPAILNRTYGRTFFWDGRVATLEEQVLLPIQHPKEMGADLPTVVQRLRADATYRRQFDDIFGRAPDVRSLSHALATYVRTILAGASDYDRYEAGESTALSPEAQQGLRLFRGRAHCARCHSGSNLTDEDFHNTGVSWGHRPYDVGRAVVTGVPEDTGKFKTPTLREIEHTAPYMHDGSIATLEKVVDFYDRGGNNNPFRDRELRRLRLTEEEKEALLAFLKSLSGQIRQGLE
ncbi:MAG: c-type cytochrome [Acidobacteria bacterium]|nr:MAG: c-type cytochrome [Acidobacteriota bacterium]